MKQRRIAHVLCVGLIATRLIAGDGKHTCVADAYVAAYPEHLSHTSDGKLIWKDGTSMVIDDGKSYSDHESWLNNADLKDQVLQCYHKTQAGQQPSVDHDPGRARYEPFFYKMYGASKSAVASKLTTIQWLPGVVNARLRVTTVNGIDKKLIAISNELLRLPASYHKYLKNPGGTFNWRTIAGTNRISTHSFGITIDINVAESHYWRNARPDKSGLYSYRNNIPLEIVKIFEKHGFIWGGRWYHYDTMHFEYRPELLGTCCQHAAQ